MIGADTVVSYEGKILGKPADETAAIEMLAMLQGNTHQVYTGVTLLIREKGRWKAHTFHEDRKSTRLNSSHPSSSRMPSSA